MTHQKYVEHITHLMDATRRYDSKGDYESAHSYEDAAVKAFVRCVSAGTGRLGEIRALAQVLVEFLDEEKGDRWFS